MVKVSVIIPFYNVEKYLSNTLSSVLAQEFENLEVILINDGSTDQSESIANKFVDSNKNITLFSQDNKGVGAARNAGIQNANGKYLLFLDSDDYLEVKAIETLFKRCDALNLDVLMFDAETVFDENLSDFKIPVNYSRSNEYADVYTGEEMFANQYSNNDFKVSPTLIMVKKKVILENKIVFPVGIIHEDQVFIFQLLLNSKRVSHIRKKMYNRVYRSNSIMTSLASNIDKSFDGYLFSLKSFILLFESYQWKNNQTRKSASLYLMRIAKTTSSLFALLPLRKQFQYRNRMHEIYILLKKTKFSFGAKNELKYSFPIFSSFANKLRRFLSGRK